MYFVNLGDFSFIAYRTTGFLQNSSGLSNISPMWLLKLPVQFPNMSILQALIIASLSFSAGVALLKHTQSMLNIPLGSSIVFSSNSIMLMEYLPSWCRMFLIWDMIVMCIDVYIDVEIWWAITDMTLVNPHLSSNWYDYFIFSQPTICPWKSQENVIQGS